MWTVEGVPGYEGGVFRSKTCLLPMVTGRSHHLIKLHEHYLKGFLLQSGGLADQPNFFLDAMQLIDVALIDE